MIFEQSKDRILSMANLIFQLIFPKVDMGLKKRDGLSIVERHVKIKELEHTTIRNCWDDTKITI